MHMVNILKENKQTVKTMKKIRLWCLLVILIKIFTFWSLLILEDTSQNQRACNLSVRSQGVDKDPRNTFKSTACFSLSSYLFFLVPHW